MKLNKLLILVITFLIFFEANSQSNPLSLNEQLLFACKNKDHGKIKQLISAGANVNYFRINSMPLSPVVVSTLMNDSTGLSILLKNNADPNINDNWAIESACMFGYPDVLDLLLNHGGKFNSEAKECLHDLVLKAPSSLKWIFLSSLLSKNEVPPIINIGNDEEDPILSMSMSLDEKPFLEGMEIVLSNGFPKNKLNGDGMTALDVAIDRANIPFIKYLVSKGLTTSYYQFKSIDLVSFAVSQGNKDLLLQSLEEDQSILNTQNSSGAYLITESFRVQNQEIAEMLLSLGANKMLIDSAGNSLLHYAAYWKSQTLDSFLFPSLDSMIAKENNEGNTPAFLSVVFGNKRLFDKMSLKTEFNNPSFTTVIHAMLSENLKRGQSELSEDQFSIVKFLDHKNVRLNGKINGESVLERLAKELKPTLQNLKLIKLLIDKHADSTEVDLLLEYFFKFNDDVFIQLLLYKGLNLSRAMNLSIVHSRTFLVNWLLSISATPAARNLAYPSALTTAVFENSTAIAAMLLEFGINPNTKNIYGFTALDYSIINGNYDLCRLLIEYGADLDLANAQSIAISFLKQASGSQMQKILGILLLKKQLLFERFKEGNLVYKSLSQITKDLQTFRKNMNWIMAPLKISVDQKPRFWDWFPYSATGNGAKHSRMGYFVHSQELSKHNNYNSLISQNDERIYIFIDDLGHLPRFNFGEWGRTNDPVKLETQMKASNIVPKVPYDTENPLSFPVIRITNSYMSNQPVELIQNLDTVFVLPKTDYEFDRSKGDVRIICDANEKTEIAIDLTITYNIGPLPVIEAGNSFTERLHTYQLLRDANEKINSGKLTSGELKSLQTYCNVLSMLAKEKGYEVAVKTELVNTIAALNKIEVRISELYELLSRSNLLSYKPRIVSLMEQIITKGNLGVVQQNAFQKFLSEIERIETADVFSNKVRLFLQDEIFTEIDGKVFDIQVLMLEAAQFLCPIEWSDQIKYVKSSLLNRLAIPSSKIIVQEGDLNGKGREIIKAIK